MYRDDEFQLYAEALGVVGALIDAARGEASKQNLRNAYEVLEKALPDADPPTPADVGVHRRESDFVKAQELLMALSLCPSVERNHVILGMMFLSKAEAQWVTEPTRRISAVLAQRLRRRRTDPAARIEPSVHTDKPLDAGERERL